MCRFAQEFLMIADKSIKLTYLLNEWDILDTMCQKKGAHNFRTYINTRLHILAKACPAIEERLMVEKRSVNYIIPPDLCLSLMSFANHRDIPLAALVRWYISDPLLKEFYDKKKN